MEKLNTNGQIVEYEFSKIDNVCEIKMGDSTLNVAIAKYDEYYLLNNKEGNTFEFADIYHGKDYSIVWIDDKEYLIKNLVEAFIADEQAKDTSIKSPMPGIIKEIKFKENENVKNGDTIIVLESMKVLNELKSSIDGVVKKIHVNSGAQVGALELLVEIEPTEVY